MDDSNQLEEGPPEEWEKDFLEAYTNDYGVLGLAAKKAGVHRKAVERRAKDSPRFKALYESAQQMVRDTMEYEAMRRALEPMERPVFQRGQLVGTISEWDTKHLEWMLERLYPEKFHIPTRIEFGAGHDGAVNFKLALGDSPPQLEEAEENDD